MEGIPGGPHSLIDILWGLLLAAGGFIVKNERDERKELEQRVENQERSFASKDDIDSVKRTVERMEDKLDRVIERRYRDPSHGAF